MTTSGRDERSITSCIDLKDLPLLPFSMLPPSLNNTQYMEQSKVKKKKKGGKTRRNFSCPLLRDVIKFQADRIKLDCFRIDLHTIWRIRKDLSLCNTPIYLTEVIDWLV